MHNSMIKLAVAGAMVAMTVAMIGVSAASAHVHVAENANHHQQLANGQNHPRFGTVDGDGLRSSCEGVDEPADAGPAGYGLETAHHGPDAGTPGKADGCFATVGNPVDGSPAIN